jgi:gamma-glutamylaminecyclotransferase
MWDHYKRLPIRVEPIDRGDAVFEVETYYEHRSYGLKLLVLS